LRVVAKLDACAFPPTGRPIFASSRLAPQQPKDETGISALAPLTLLQPFLQFLDPL